MRRLNFRTHFQCLLKEVDKMFSVEWILPDKSICLSSSTLLTEMGCGHAPALSIMLGRPPLTAFYTAAFYFGT